MTSFRSGKEGSSMHKYETSIFAELECSGYWRLQSDEPSLTAKLRHRASEKSSPWSITGTPMNAKSPWIFRRRFTCSTNAKKSLERILMRLDAEPFELVDLIDGKGWNVKRPSARRNSGEMHARLIENEQCNGEEKEVA